MKKIVYIVILMIIGFLLIFGKGLFSSSSAQDIIGLIFGLIVAGTLIFDSYRVIKRKEFKTDLYIVLSNIVAIMSLVGASYYIFKAKGETNPEMLNYIGVYLLAMQGIFFAALIGRTILKTNVFRKK